MKTPADNKKDAPDEEGSVRTEQPAERPKGDDPQRERRSKHRVADDQGSGKGASSALSKLRMLERRRASISPRGDREKD